MTDGSSDAKRLPCALGAILLAVALSYVFWRPLWHGGGLVGGDTYSYFFPQKTFLADQLQSGNLPLWNPLVGHGYPVVAESQTGVLYPPNLVLFRFLDVNTAYNASQILHYVLAFLTTWFCARRMGLRAFGAMLASVVFVYGWFPPRICLEWAILGGVYFPLAIWCVESYLQTGRLIYLPVLSAALGIHLLAGHYNLAFITVLTAGAYGALRLCYARDNLHAPAGGARGRAGAAIVLALAAGFALAAVQLTPSWELKQISQRAEVGGRHDPGYGHIPPWYLSQVIAPWLWYAPDVNADQALNSIKVLSIPSLTNKVEAHLYFGLVPLALVVGGAVYRRARGEKTPRRLVVWSWLGLAAVVYATGWLLPVTRHLPGFNFFMGPGRYGIVATLAVGLLAGYTLDEWLGRLPRGAGRLLVVVLVLGAAAADLWIVRCRWNRTVEGAPNWYADLVADPPIRHRNESAIREALAKYPRPVRLFAPGQNLPTLTGFAMTPPYLGLGPSEYFDPQLTMPRAENDPPTANEIAAQVKWLQQAGVTHVLREEPLDRRTWPVKLVWQGHDRVLNAAWARREPLYLYELEGTRGRVAWQSNADNGPANVTHFDPERVEIGVNARGPGQLVLTDLYYPGWSVTVDGQPAEALRVDGMFRGVQVPAGEHTVAWEYHPRSLAWGGIVSAAALVVLIVLAVGSLRRRRAATSGEGD